MRAPRTLLLLLVTALLGCIVPSGRIVAYETDPETGETVEVEAKEPIAGGRVLAHLIITLGDERLPEEYTIDRPVDRSRDEVEAVYEVYFTNESADPIVLRNVRYGPLPLGPSEIEIPPDKFCKTDSVVRWASVFRAPRPQLLSYDFEGTTHTVELAERRTLVDELYEGRQDANGSPAR